jgi:hypothetical protein
MLHKWVFAFVLVLVFLSKAYAVPFDEASLVGGDAGNFVTAPAVDLTGIDATTITGIFSDDPVTGSDQDAYIVHILGGGTFSATTVGSVGSIDTQLFLFDLTTGFPIYANDDDPTLPGPPFNDLLSTLPALNPLTPVTPGSYLLVVTRFDSDPLGAGGASIFDPLTPVLTGPILSGLSNLPIGYSANLPISPEPYIIALTGTASAPLASVPEPSTFLLLVGGIVLLVAGRGKILGRKRSFLFLSCHAAENSKKR